jgi:hypothetical protein
VEGRFVEEDVSYRRTFCLGGHFVEGRSVEERLVGRTFCSEGHFVEGRFVEVPVYHQENKNSALFVFPSHKFLYVPKTLFDA